MLISILPFTIIQICSLENVNILIEITHDFVDLFIQQTNLNRFKTFVETSIVFFIQSFFFWNQTQIIAYSKKKF